MAIDGALVLVLMAIGAIILVRYWRKVLWLFLVLAATGTCYGFLNVAEVMQR